jgi:hypothetical protein
MTRDNAFTLKIAMCNAIGFFVISAGVTLVDARLSSHVAYGARYYPLRFWICLAAPIVFVVSLISVRRSHSWKARAVWPSLCLLLIGSPCLLNFRPAFPHTGFCLGILLCCLVSFITSWIYYLPFEVDWIDDRRIDRLLKLERIKEIVTLWRTLALSVTFGYLALLIPWQNLIWSTSHQVVTKPDEMTFLSSANSVALSAFSLFVLFCPVYESFREEVVPLVVGIRPAVG